MEIVVILLDPPESFTKMAKGSKSKVAAERALNIMET